MMVKYYYIYGRDDTLRGILPLGKLSVYMLNRRGYRCHEISIRGRRKMAY